MIKLYIWRKYLKHSLLHCCTQFSTDSSDDVGCTVNTYTNKVETFLRFFQRFLKRYSYVFHTCARFRAIRLGFLLPHKHDFKAETKNSSMNHIWQSRWPLSPPPLSHHHYHHHHPHRRRRRRRRRRRHHHHHHHHILYLNTIKNLKHNACGVV